VKRERVLVIRLSALGDFVLSFGPFAAIRAHHPDAEITLLTTAAYAGLAGEAPWFDRGEIDARPSWWDIPGLARLWRQLQGFDIVYDLQTSGRSSRYFTLAGRPPWSGIAPGCRFEQSDPARETMHTIERQRDQLEIAGITAFPPPDLEWLAHRPVPDLPRRFVLLVPGAAPSRPAKRWPVENFAELAVYVADRGAVPVVIGGKGEADLAAIIQARCPSAIDLTGGTEMADLFAIAARATLAVGNDTGPMHIAAAVGCPCVVLFSGDSNPDMTAPRGPGGTWPVVLREKLLADLTVGRVVEALRHAA
jgi:ADP-heptose:LPS heptosyltransferase